MISFAYRYQYLDEEYSSLSQFTDIAFAPGVFAYDPSTNLNKGMTNISIQTQTFSNSKIYTTLPESELLRLYDNVPLIAKAQTIMANRLVYGNYEDGRDVVDSNGVNCRMTYAAELNSQDIQSDTIQTTSVTGINYTIDTTETITGSAIDMDFSGVKSNLKLGAFLGVTITYIKNKYTGNTGTVTGNQGSTVIEFLYTLTETFSTVQAMAVSDSFKAAVVTGFQTVGNCATGTTFTDTYNCSIENPAEGNPDITWQKDEAGITGLNQGILITSSAGSDIITLQLPAMRFSDIEGTAPAPPYLYAYYNILNSSATFVTEEAQLL